MLDYARKDSKGAPKARLSTMDAVRRKPWEIPRILLEVCLLPRGHAVALRTFNWPFLWIGERRRNRRSGRALGWRLVGTADQCNKALGQELSAGKGKVFGAAANAAREREVAAWKRFAVFEPAGVSTPSKVLNWKMAEGEKNAEAA